MTELYNFIDQAKEDIEKEFNSLQKVTAFGFDLLLAEIDEDQLLTLLLGCDWARMNLLLNFGAERDEDGFKKNNNKKGGNKKKSKITKSKIEEYLSSDEANKTKYSLSFQKVKFAALRAWLPSQHQFNEFENELLDSGVGKRANAKLKIRNPKELKKDKEVAAQQNKKVEGKEGNEDGFYEMQDEQEIEDEQKERMAALTNPNFKVQSDFNDILIKVDYKKNIANDEGNEDNNNNTNTIKSFSSAALDKIENSGGSLLLSLHENLWEMDTGDRIRFVQMIVAKETHHTRSNFQDSLHRYEELCKQKSELENQHTAEVLRYLGYVTFIYSFYQYKIVLLFHQITSFIMNSDAMKIVMQFFIDVNSGNLTIEIVFDKLEW